MCGNQVFRGTTLHGLWHFRRSFSETCNRQGKASNGRTAEEVSRDVTPADKLAEAAAIHLIRRHAECQTPLQTLLQLLLQRRRLKVASKRVDPDNRLAAFLCCDLEQILSERKKFACFRWGLSSEL